MPRYCFRLTVRADRLDEYIARHARVWPEMLRALAEAGWRNYSIFAGQDGTIVGYVEADDLEQAQRAMAMTDVNRRWQHEMSPFFVGLAGKPADEALELLPEIFNLERQLEGADGGDGGSSDQGTTF